ncbi:MAG: exodeoxyribonuclease V subunit alpha [Azoarcus sp.]|jgi:exodeoxyribonuclease V alpha subunit|nr:exodeoxyribonuclease V subunit alpha [Azoarcus sp.]
MPDSQTLSIRATRDFPMNAPDLPSSAQYDLATGFAAHIERWARRGTESDHALLVAVARRLALAACEGHVRQPLHGLVAGQTAAEIRHALLASGVAAEPDMALTPLVIDDDCLYLRAFFDLETHLAIQLDERARMDAPLSAEAERTSARRVVLERFFPPRTMGVDWQKVAVAQALERRLTIISGGPGTGKTTTVAALIACLLELDPGIRVGLAAPTGKAAARMLEALTARARDLPESVRGHLPRAAHTIHRLLGASATPGRFRHHAANPLALDLLVVDEASMLDLALATRLVDALPPDARLVLLGDKDQLAAVEAGSVFADLSAGWRFSPDEALRLEEVTGAPVDMLVQGGGEPALTNSVVWLTESHRFSATSGIGRLARQINAGHGAEAFGRQDDDEAVRWIDDEGATPAAATLEAMSNRYSAYFGALAGLAASSLDALARARQAFAVFDRFRVLVAVHEGARGLAAINAQLTQLCLSHYSGLREGPFWAGRPVIVLENDPLTGLYNGDVGLTLFDDSGKLRVFFPRVDGSYRALAPQRLPRHDTAFALTVHKSQGSEFDEILLLLPATPVRVLTRELLYTGLTRARTRVTIAGGREVFAAACATSVRRFSGLGARLRSGDRIEDRGNGCDEQ